MDADITALFAFRALREVRHSVPDGVGKPTVIPIIPLPLDFRDDVTGFTESGQPSSGGGAFYVWPYHLNLAIGDKSV
jgi:hypothetical protein